MAQIRDELILVDRFTNTMTTYIRLADQAAGESESVTRAARRMAESQETAASSTSILNSQLGTLLKTYLGFQGVKMLVGLSDQMTQVTARLNQMNDGLQTTEELQQMIFDSAQRSRGSYLGTLEMVSKLGTMAGDAFGSNEELVAFAEQINKQITLSGASTQAADAAMLQLTQAMSSGVLRGEELNSILEQTPTIAQTIARYLGVSTGEMREMASEGQITADVVKAAMFSAAEETNAAFAQIPLTWGQLWTSVQNTAIMALQPLLDLLSSIPQAISDNMDLVIAVFVAGGAAIAIALAPAAVQAAIMAASFLAATWPLLLMVGIVSAFIYGLMQAGYTAGDVGAEIGQIFGWLYAFIGNIVVTLYNLWASFAEFFANVFNDPIGAAARLFFDFVDGVLSVLQTVGGALDALFGSNLADTMQGFRNSIQSWVDETIGENEIQIDRMEHIDFDDAMNQFAGYGRDIGDSLAGLGDSVGSESYDFDSLASNVAQMAGDTKSIKNSVSMAQEDVKMIVDMAERQFVAQVNLTTAAPTITINGRGGTSRAQDNHILGELSRMLGGQSSASARLSTAQTR